jgi:hypothetical protein
MRLYRNISNDGLCKYALIDNRTGKVTQARVGDPDEFFAIKLKDEFAEVALRAMAEAARSWDPEYAADLDALADRAGPHHPLCKKPD